LIVKGNVKKSLRNKIFLAGGEQFGDGKFAFMQYFKRLKKVIFLGVVLPRFFNKNR
jgi:hypothetical protein